MHQSLKKLLILGCVATLASRYVHAQEAHPEELILRVDTGNVSSAFLSLAKVEAAHVLSHAGVTVRWKGLDDHHRVHDRLRECTSLGVDVTDILILVQDHTPVTDHPGALGFAMPFAKSGYRVVIFYDRVMAITDRPNPAVLGHVIAHEVGHILLGSMSHAPAGVMNAHWTAREVAEMQIHPLAFHAGDIDTIFRRLNDQRHACVASGLVASAAIPPDANP